MMNTMVINKDKVIEALKPALAYQAWVKPRVTVEQNHPLVLIELPGSQPIDMKEIEAVSTALCGFLWHRGQVGVVNGNLCLSFWKSDLQNEFIEGAEAPAAPDATVGTYDKTP